MLPEPYRSKIKWILFFRELGLKQTVTQDEFILFCNETASAEVTDIKECSDVLLEYLFTHYGKKDAVFLQKVAEIPFVFQEHLPELTWIVRSVFPANQMVKLNGSAPLNRASLLWTVKPIVHLPADCLPTRHSLTAMDVQEVLGIAMTPSTGDVISNIKCICEKSRFTEQSLFANYPDHLLCKGDKWNILDIMAENLTYLDSRTVSSADVDQLQCLPCIPVPSTTVDQFIQKSTSIVLVQPCSVVHSDWDQWLLKKFHPFLHLLPERLNSQQKLLKSIGVKSRLELSHIQVALDGAYKASEGAELDPNTSECVKVAVENLHKLLDDLRKEPRETVKRILTPLYLPDSENHLRPTKSLIYGDTIRYWGNIELDLSMVEYFHFNITYGDYKLM